MGAVADSTIAVVAFLLVTASFPFYLYGAWIMIDAETVTWDTLIYHLQFIVPGLLLNTIPVVFWMGPRLFDQLNGISALHAPDREVDLDDLHENMSAWRGRLRLGVFGYVIFWILAYAVGVFKFVSRYGLPF
jgi:hypothetical protein